MLGQQTLYGPLPQGHFYTPQGALSPGQFMPGQPLVPNQPTLLTHSQAGMQSTIFPHSAPVGCLGWLALLLFAASVLLNITSGFWGPGSLLFSACPSASTSHAIVISAYVAFGISLLYSLITRSWAAESYRYAIAVSILGSLAVVMKGLLKYSKSNALETVSSLPAQLLVMVALLVALYYLWWSVYRPIDYDWMGSFARNAVAFYLGWVLFAAVKMLWVGLGRLLQWRQQGNRTLFWLLQILAFGVVACLVYRGASIQGLQALSGFFLVMLWVFAACLLQV